MVLSLEQTSKQSDPQSKNKILMNKILLTLMAIFAFGLQNVCAQDAPLKIVTNHPDFKIKIERCAASGKTVVIDMLFSNEGTDDADGVSVVTNFEGRQCEAYDSEGNVYRQSISAYAKGLSDQYGNVKNFSLIPDVPMKIRITIDEFSETAEKIARLRLRVDCRKWKIGSGKLVEIRNVPITRD